MLNEQLVTSLRKYQLDAITAANNTKENCLLVLPTGAGKSHIIAGICVTNPTKRILILSHVSEILLQNVEKLTQYISSDLIGIYAAGLGLRTFGHHCVAMIQSVYTRTALLTNYDIIIVDEAHMIPPEGEGRYRTLFQALPNKKVIGLTATPYRYSSGYLTDGPLFKTVAYTADILDLIEQKYLCKLTAKSSEHKFDTVGLKHIGGDFAKKDMLERFDKAKLTSDIVHELTTKYTYRKHWLIFAIDIAHAEHVAESLKEKGITVDVLHSKKSKSRTDVIKRFKEGKIQALVNVEILTTGFDAPNIDLIVLLRPTESPGLHVQMIGRGLRVAPNKQDCLVLDYAGNVERLGPINNVQVKAKGNKKKESEAPCKVCPECLEVVAIGTKLCPGCSHEFPQIERGKKLSNIASNADILEVTPKEKFTTYNVDKIFYYRHQKRNSPDSLKVVYECGLKTFSQWVCIEHVGRPRLVAIGWWQYRGQNPVPKTVGEALERQSELKFAKQITVYNKGPFPEIVRVSL